MKQSHFMKIYTKRRLPKLIGLILCVIIFIAVACLIGFKCYNYDKNPAIIKTHEDYMKAIKNNSFVNIYSKELYDLDIEVIETESRGDIKISEETKSIFVAMKLDGKLLPVCLPISRYEEIVDGETGPYFIWGSLTKIEDEDLPLFRNSLIECGFSPEGVDLLLNTYYLEYETPLQSASKDLSWMLLIMMILSLAFIPFLHRTSSALKSLKKYSKDDLERTYEQIDKEITSHDVYKDGPITITEHYIMVDSRQVFFVLPLKELMWVYRRTVHKKIYGIIPSGKKENIIFVFSNKKPYIVDLHKKHHRIDSTLQYISAHCDTTIVGFSKELKRLFRRKPNEFVRRWKEDIENKCYF